MDLEVTRLPTQFNPALTSTQAPFKLNEPCGAVPFPDLVSPVKMEPETGTQMNCINSDFGVFFSL